MQTNVEEVIELFRRAVRLKRNTYLYKMNYEVCKLKKDAKLNTYALAYDFENKKWAEVVSRASEFFKACSVGEQSEILKTLAQFIDIQKNALKQHPASFIGWSTEETTKLFFEQTKQVRAGHGGRK